MGEKIERQCPVCGKTYIADKTRLKHRRETTCSRKCSYELRSGKLKNSRTLTCPVCGNEFTRPISRIERTKYTNVCSLECLYKGRTLGIIKREVEHQYNISDEGRMAWAESARKRIGKYRKEPHEFLCEFCGETFYVSRDNYNNNKERRFCSCECANSFNVGKNNAAWRGGHDGYYGPSWRAQQRLARKRDNYTCQRCGITEKQNKRKLDVHHIVRFGDFDNTEQANCIDNLISLCHKCHSITEWQSENR